MAKTVRTGSSIRTANETCLETGCGRAGSCRQGVLLGTTVTAHYCECLEPWGGARCDVYVGRDHACNGKCDGDDEFCAWVLVKGAPESSGAAACVRPPPPAPPASGHGAVLAALLVISAAAVLVYLGVRRRRRSFQHLRLPDNVEISNPMYLGGADDDDAAALGGDAATGAVGGGAGTHRGGNHFANPVYETVYAKRDSNEEHANLLLESTDGAAL